MDTFDINIKDRIMGCILGGAIGDALGYQCEFTVDIKEREFTTFKDDYGIFSDDTQMMLFTINGLLWGATRAAAKGIAPLPISCINYAYRDWYKTQNNVSWIDKIPAMRHRRAPGFTCLNALNTPNPHQFGTIDNSVNQSKGCGCTMRVAPVGIFAHSLQETIELSAESAAITHGHPLGIISTAFIGSLIYLVTHETGRSFSEQFHAALESTNQFAAQHFHYQYQSDFAKIINEAFTLSQNHSHDIDNIGQLGQGWVAEEAAAIATYCCLRYPDNYADAVIASVNHGGDSDSTGIITGNIMGARLGIRAIPQYYLDHIEQYELLTELATDFANGVPSDFNDSSSDSSWSTKYIKCQPLQESL